MDLFITNKISFSFLFFIAKHHKFFNDLLSWSVVTMIGALAFPSPFIVDANTKML